MSNRAKHWKKTEDVLAALLKMIKPHERVRINTLEKLARREMERKTGKKVGSGLFSSRVGVELENILLLFDLFDPLGQKVTALPQKKSMGKREQWMLSRKAG